MVGLREALVQLVERAPARLDAQEPVTTGYDAAFGAAPALAGTALAVAFALPRQRIEAAKEVS